MHVKFDFVNLDSQERLYLSWAPEKAAVRLIDAPATTNSLDVTLTNSGTVGKVWFATEYIDEGSDSLNLTLPSDGSEVEFWLGGTFQSASENYGDAEISAIAADTGAGLGQKELMVRVRKNANLLSNSERDRFLSALAILNGQGAGRFSELRDMHQDFSTNEAHGNHGFLPWHRAYMLDLERELQVIDAAVALPYWRFDQAAPNVFTTEFMGLPLGFGGRLSFSQGHPLETWVTDNQVGLRRPMSFAPSDPPTSIRSEAATLGLGGATNDYSSFLTLEGNPHGRAHTRFGGPVSQIQTAARDPLFFMLHANVDRLWAKWQWFHERHNSFNSLAYGTPDGNQVGHRLDDTMWPWNGVTGGGRPATAPGGALASSDTSALPGNAPTVRQMVDYMNVRGNEDTTTGGTLGFCYDDVPFAFEDDGVGS